MVKIAIYVDTSGSMNERIQGEMSEDFSGETNSIFSKIRRGIGLKGKVKKQLVAKAMWENLVPTFKDRQTKVSTINSRGRSRVLAPLDFRSHEDLLKIQFPKANGGTYLWKFLVEEAEERVALRQRAALVAQPHARVGAQPGGQRADSAPVSTSKVGAWAGQSRRPGGRSAEATRGVLWCA